MSYIFNSLREHFKPKKKFKFQVLIKLPFINVNPSEWNNRGYILKDIHSPKLGSQRNQRNFARKTTAIFQKDIRLRLF